MISMEARVWAHRLEWLVAWLASQTPCHPVQPKIRQICWCGDPWLLRHRYAPHWSSILTLKILGKLRFIVLWIMKLPGETDLTPIRQQSVWSLGMKKVEHNFVDNTDNDRFSGHRISSHRFSGNDGFSGQIVKKATIYLLVLKPRPL